MGCLLLLDAVFAPTVLAEHPPPPPSENRTGVAAPSASEMSAPTPARRPTDPADRVPTIVAKFESSSKEPTDESGIKALATAMIESHEARIVLEGHSDTQGTEDSNHEISLACANWVKDRLVQRGVSAARIETVGLGATRPIRQTLGDAQVMNRRVEVRWVGK